MAREVDSVSGFLKKQSSIFLSKAKSISTYGPSFGSENYNNLLTEMLAPTDDGETPSHGFIALYDDGDGAGFDLFRFVKARLKGKPKLIYVRVDPFLPNPITCVLNGKPNYYEPRSFEETFGLYHDSGWYGEGGYFTKHISFNGGSPGPSVFRALGIKRRPRGQSYIDIFTKTDEEFKIPKSTIFVSQGEEIVRIEGKVITSKIPVYIHGNSADWRINGDLNSDTLEAHPWNNAQYRKRDEWSKNWAGKEARVIGGATKNRTDFSDLYFDGK